MLYDIWLGMILKNVTHKLVTEFVPLSIMYLIAVVREAVIPIYQPFLSSAKWFFVLLM